MFKNKFLLTLILILAISLRLYGLNWDQNQHLHPDERFLTMVIGSLKWPNSFKQYLNPPTSPLNPYNANYHFFVYGTLPLTINKAVAELVKFSPSDYDNFTLVGRFVSALLDLGTTLLVFLIGKKVFNHKIGLLASFLYAISVLPIQLSHFFAVDTFLVFLLTLSFYFLIFWTFQPSNLLISILLGTSFGFALACKINAFLFLPIISLGYFSSFLKKRKIKTLVVNGAFFVLFSYLALRIGDPRIFVTGNLLDLSINPLFIRNLNELKLSSLNDPKNFFPPAIHWFTTKPIIFPLKNLILWGLGFPLGIISLISIFFSLILLSESFFKRKMKKSTPRWENQLMVVVWILFLFFFQGIQFGKPMRYFFLIYPFLALLSANFISQMLIFLKRIKSSRVNVLGIGLIVLILIYPLSFMSIYTHLHSRVAASKWIYQNIPSSSVLSCDSWDDCLPLSLNGHSSSQYQTEMLAFFPPDVPEKWEKLNSQLEKIEYLVFSSNRFYGCIPKLPEKYPVASQFYQNLFSGKLDFKKIAEFTSYPCFPPIGQPLFCLPDQSADESFTVYDHPRVLIYQKLKAE